MIDNTNTSRLSGPSVTDRLTELEKNGYVLKLRRESTCIYCFELDEWIVPANFNVDQFYYFQETGSPDADRMLYAISISKGLKGYLLDTCYVYADNISAEMMEKLALTQIADFLINKNIPI